MRIVGRLCIGVIIGVCALGVLATSVAGGRESDLREYRASARVSVHAAVWIRPVAGSVVAPFRAPIHPYGPGHRGVDLAASPGTPVRAAGPGVVTFAGAVADGLHVTIAHAGDRRTSYAFLATVTVRMGATVGAGQVIGTTGGSDPDSGHGDGALHFSLRRGDRYLDPMSLFAPVDLGAVVHLVPVTG